MNERTCIVSKQCFDADELIRFVAGPQGNVVADLKRTLPGRGVWVRASREVVDEAVSKKLFARGLKKNVIVSSSLGDEIDQLLESAALAALGFARKASQCVAGSRNVDSAVRHGKAIGVLHAVDAAEDGIRKLSGAIHASGLDGRKVKVLQLFDSDKLSVALGGVNVVHAALTGGGAANSFLKRAKALVRYRGISPKTGESDRLDVANFQKDVSKV